MASRHHPARKHPSTRGLLSLLACALSAACSAGGGAPSGAAPAGSVSEEVWRSLASERPTPLATATRITVGSVELLGEAPWGVTASIDLELGLSELVVAGLLRRPDVHFVERRRFAAAAEASRRGTLPPNAPPVGISVGPEYVLSLTWATFGLADAYLEMRLIDAESGAVEHSWRESTPTNADAVGLARLVVGSLVEQLGTLRAVPDWADPVAMAAPDDFVATAIGGPALTAYLEGLAAEERWEWEAARRGYQRALAADPSFFEAEVALARTARLRLGGTLGAS